MERGQTGGHDKRRIFATQGSCEHAQRRAARYTCTNVAVADVVGRHHVHGQTNPTHATTALIYLSGHQAGRQLSSMYIGFSSNPLSRCPLLLSSPLFHFAPSGLYVYIFSPPPPGVAPLYECERGKITLARFSWGFPPPFPSLSSSRFPYTRKGESSLYETRGGAVTAETNP